MATVSTTKPQLENIDYPTADGRPMAETDFHYVIIKYVRELLDAWFAADPSVYVSGNLLLFYEKGKPRRHVSPDIFVVKGVPKVQRLHYLLWEEKKGPDIAIEITSKSTRREDLQTKFALYRDVLRIPEYFLFDPLLQYLDPPLQGYRLKRREYVPIDHVHGRLPSTALGLHFETDGRDLRFFDPATEAYLSSPQEKLARETTARQQAELAARLANEAQRRAEEETRRLREELEKLRLTVNERNH